MSRIRSVHPGLWSDERFVSVTAWARLLFVGLWNECDDQGSFEWSPLKLKMRIFPADSIDVAPLLMDLEAAGCVMRYEAGARPYGAIRNFCRWQRPKKPNTIYPQPSEVRDWVAAAARQTRTGGEPVGDEFGTGGERVGNRSGKRPPEEGGRRKEGGFPLPEDHLSYEGKGGASENWAGAGR